MVVFLDRGFFGHLLEVRASPTDDVKLAALKTIIGRREKGIGHSICSFFSI